MERAPVVSESVASVGFDEGSSTLEVEFSSGSVYQYFDVPQTVFEELVGADSIGTYLNRSIKGSYRYARA